MKRISNLLPVSAFSSTILNQLLVRKSLIFLILLISVTPKTKAGKYDIIPTPKIMIPRNGAFSFNRNTVIRYDITQPETGKIAIELARQIEIVTGILPKIKSLSAQDTINSVSLIPVKGQPLEAYSLSVSAHSISIRSSSPNGFFYGLQTLYQLLPPEIYKKTMTRGLRLTAACVYIYDAPRFSYRGLHLDVGRHFFPVSFIKKYIDAMTIHKLNTFHWHLTEDQGWRIEIKKYPQLTRKGAFRDETLIGTQSEYFPPKYDGKPYGGYYTQEEAREIVKYAADRFITIIPEIEMPGHAQAALASYPFLSCSSDSTIKVATSWGIFKNVYCPSEQTFTFLENVLTEIMDIFPGKYIHIGGDECPKDEWKKSALCQQLIRENNLKDENGLQSYFIHRIEKFLNAHGRSIIGWDEILDGGLAPNATVMSWRGTAGGIAAAKAGHDVIMTPGNYCYFDHYQGNPETEPRAIGGFLPLRMVYEYEPVGAELTATEANYILGAQANVWTEYITDSQQVEYMVFPRLAAMSEVLWSSPENKNWDNFRQRLLSQFSRYKAMDIHYANTFSDVWFQSASAGGNNLEISLNCDNPDATIHYTENGAEKTYLAPFIIDKTSEITAAAYVRNMVAGKTITHTFHISKLTNASYTRNFENQWFNGGNLYALTDGIYGNVQSTNQWVAFRKGGDAQITIDLKKPVTLQHFSVGLLQAPGLCALASTNIQVLGSTDGKNFGVLSSQEVKPTVSDKWEILRPVLQFSPTTVTQLKVVVSNPGNCPLDPPSLKNGGVIFMDEMEAW